MNKRCIGCGALLQTKNIDAIGYIKEENLVKNSLCERCFRIRNYGDYKIIAKDNNEYLNILEDISKTNDLVILVVDVFCVNDRLNDIGKILKNPVLLVLSKRDVLPHDIYEQKILDYMDKFSLNIVDKILISSNKNYQLDELFEMINKYKKSKNVYIVGYSNAGKSTLINKLLYNYSNNETTITTSILPSTTLDKIEIKLNDDLTLIDTPGLIDSNNIINMVSGKELKKIIPSKEIKPITYQIKNKQYIKIDNYAVIDCLEITNITLFFSEKLKIDRFFNSYNNKNLEKHSFILNAGKDIVINGLGFIKVSKNCKIDIYTMHNVNVFVRDSLI